MADYITPTKTEFKNAEQVAVDVITQSYPNIVTKTGSVLRELIIRPASYLMSWLTANISNDIRQYSVSYLKTSQLTDNPIADMVASNYFVIRQEGTRAKGVVTLELELSTLRIAAGALFNVGGVQMCTAKQYLITASPLPDTETIGYIKAIPYGGNYIANVPVVAVAVGEVEVPVGSPVTLGFGCTTLVSAELTSPVTGGSGVETDAQLMQRAEYNTAAAGIGSYYGIKKKMTKAPIDVPGLSVIAGEDAPLFRARNNSVGINPGGYVDCHAKTANQISVGTIVDHPLTIQSFNVKQPDGTYVTVNKGVINLEPNDFAGLIRVTSVLVDGIVRDKWEVDYGTDDINSTVEGARLSASQTARVILPLENNGNTNTPITATSNTAVTVEYMPGIDILQDYMDNDNEHFIGQDIRIKAAVPVSVGVTCSLYCPRELGEDELDGLRQAIVDYINTTEVGKGKLNFSDIREACLKSYPDVTLRLPCVMTASVCLRDGNLDSFHTTSGILDITHNPTYNKWGYQICYFSACKENVGFSIV